MPAIRSAEEIFEDLRQLCREPGFLHAISSIKFRDFYASVDPEGSLNPGPEDRYARSRLNNNELALLAGLVAQSDDPNVFRDIGDTQLLVSRADRLLEELHTNLEAPMRQAFQSPPLPNAPPHRFGDLAREAIYYGAESAFPSQYQRFARDRYRTDFEWLLRNKGLSIRPMIEIARRIVELVDLQINYLLAYAKYDVTRLPPEHLTRGFIISKEAIRAEFSSKADRFLECFSVPINRSNLGFTDPFSCNELTSRPFLDIGTAVYLTNSYDLFESLYESPYYWMLQDHSYRDTASQNRGKFLERTITMQARNVFGKQHVFPNVLIRKNKQEIAAEADVLIVYGEFILVIQAKSKRLPIPARAGSEDNIRFDFQEAIQAAYDQATNFIELILDGAECEFETDQCRSFKFLARMFPLVVLSDHFPSLTMLTNHLITVRKNWHPIVLDLFFLDVFFKILGHPVDALYYLQQRARFFDRIWADSEFELLGFHTVQKLYVPDNCDGMVVDRRFGGEINDYFLAREAGVVLPIKFRPLEERVDVPIMTELISALKAGPPDVAGAAIELLDFSEEALQRIADNVAMVREEVKAKKPLRAFSLETHYGGVTYIAVKRLNKGSIRTAELIARKHKYNTKKDRWYILLDHVYSKTLIDGILPICEAWAESREMEKLVQDVDTLVRSTTLPFGTQAPTEEGETGDTR